MRLTERILALLLLTAPFAGLAQETLGPLTGNAEVAKGWADRNFYHSKGANRSGDTLQLPFIDDFSRFSSPFPDQSKWTDKCAWINATMPLRPWSIGVATLDGLNEFGRPYSFYSLIESLRCDSLTSQPIDLSNTQDTVILTFYYQAQGLGNSPEPKDSLVLELKDTAGEWRSVWRSSGYVLTDSTFKRVMQPIMGGEFLYKGFQFRFLNYATPTGSLDHWHIDYLELDDERTMADTLRQDMAFYYQTEPWLDDYEACPWTHYVHQKTISTEPICTKSYPLYLHNIHFEDVQPGFGISVRDNLMNEINPPINGSAASSVFAHKWCNTGAVAGDPNICGEVIAYDVNYELPTSTSMVGVDSTHFFVLSTISTTVTDPRISSNDTVLYKQEFYNFYAYDDGTAENAYGILDVPNALFAYRFNIYKPDVLRGLQIYFNPVIDNAELLQRFKIKVWTGAQVPETIVYEDTAWRTPVYDMARNYYHHYMITDQVVNVQSGLLFIGIQQESGVMINVGLDRNRNSNENMFYFLGEDWVQSTIKGSWMMRPTFGAAYTWTDVADVPARVSIGIYPNPADQSIHVTGCDATDVIDLLDAQGRLVSRLGKGNGPFDVSAVQPGFYLVRVTRSGTVVGTQRLIRQ